LIVIILERKRTIAITRARRRKVAARGDRH